MRLVDALLALFIAFAWGSYFIINKLAFSHTQPIIFASLRFGLVFIITFPFLIGKEIPWKKIYNLSFILVLNLILINYAVFFSNNLIPIIVTNELVVPITLFISAFFLKEKIDRYQIIGASIALIGVAIAVSLNYKSIDFKILFITFIASGLFALYNFEIKKNININPLCFLSALSLFSSLQFLIFSMVLENDFSFKKINGEFYLYLLYIVFVCTIMSYVGWLYLLKRYKLNKVIPFVLLSPIFGCLSSSIIFQEKISLNLIIGGFMVVCGIYLIESRGKHAEKKL